jgi:glycosyltransferase involved in cell wall biosynthesis
MQAEAQVKAGHGADADMPAAREGQGKKTIYVLSSLFPSRAQPTAGLFVRERVFRLRPAFGLVVIAPQPWFPLQSLIRRFKPGYRPETGRFDVQDGVEVFFPRFFSLPGVLRRLDGLSMALCALPLLLRLRRRYGQGILDAHFAYPNGRAAVLLGKWLGWPTSITLRGTETRQLKDPTLAPQVVSAVRQADQVISVSDSLRQLLVQAGADAAHIEVVGNGVDIGKFTPIPRGEARRRMGLPPEAKVLISVGGLVERKGFHRVLEILPELIRVFPQLRYIIVGGASPEGDMSQALRDQVRDLGLSEHVIFTGALPPEQLSVPLSSADVFILSTRNEGWANVFLEAMGCGLPVVTTAVGGNAEVVCSPRLGTVVPFGDQAALREATAAALMHDWDRQYITAHARDNAWDARMRILVDRFRTLGTGVRRERKE